ncbi:B12-binding domain-containing radical SAM protein [Thermodesulfobacteriota bacterium]
MTSIVLVRQSKPHYEVNYTHPLGLMCLGAYIRGNGGHRVSILDNRIEQWEMGRLLDETLDRSPDVVGLTGLTSEARILNEFSIRLREKAPGIRQVVGGVHATCFSEEVLRESGVDVVVSGEGEATLEELVETLVSDGDLGRVAGSAFLDGGRFRRTEPREPIEDLDALPFPAWDLIPVEKYFGKRMGDLLFSRPEQMSLYTSRSCPYQCIYCHNLFGRGFRAQGADSVFEQIKVLYESYKIREFHVQDDIFNLDLNRAKTICRRIIEDNLDLVLAFPNGLRADLMDDELIDLLHRAGARRIAYAVESGSPRVQGMIEKRLDLAKVSDIVAKTAKRGILVKGFFMMGFPTETLEEMRQTIVFARNHAFDVVNFSRVIPTKGTRIYEMAKSIGLKTDHDYDQYVYDYSDINLSSVDDRTFERTIRRAYLSFMSRPRRLFRLLWLFPNKEQIFPYYFMLMMVKLFTPKRPGKTRVGARPHRWWRIRY